MPDKPLTPRQREYLDAFAGFVREHSYSPTLRELAELLGVSRNNGVHEQLAWMTKKGVVKQLGALGQSRRWSITAKGWAIVNNLTPGTYTPAERCEAHGIDHFGRCPECGKVT